MHLSFKKKITTILDSIFVDKWLPSVTTLIEGIPLVGGMANDAATILSPAASPVVTGNVGSSSLNGAMLSFDGTSTSSVTVADSGDMDFGAADLTIEFWVNPANITQAAGILNKQLNNSSWLAPFFITQSGNAITLNAAYAGATGWNIASGIQIGTVEAGKWTHIAVVRSGNSMLCFCNGLPTQTISLTPGKALFYSAAPIRISGNITSVLNSPFTGLIDMVRITKGVARYSLPFTPDKSYAMDNSDAYWVNVLVAMNFETGIVDLKGHTTVSLGAGAIIMQPGRYRTDSINIGTSASYVTITGGLATFIAGSEFTIDMNAKLASAMVASASAQGLVGSAKSGAGWGFYTKAGSLYFNDGVNVISTPITAAEWHHIAVSRTNGVITLYIDGLPKATSNNNALFGTAASWFIGKTGDTGAEGSHVGTVLSDVRVTRDVARWKTAFSPATYPAQDYTQHDYFWDSVELLMHCDDLTDVRGHTLTKVGNPQIIAGDSMIFGKNSIKFDATSGLSIASTSDFGFGTTDFTIEMFIKPSAISLCPILDFRTAAVASGVCLTLAAGGQLSFSNNVTGASVTGTTVMAVNTWYHVAACRLNGVISIYVNGKFEGSFACAQDFGPSLPLQIGVWAGGLGANKFVGSIDELRITTASRYTKASFAAPTSDYNSYVYATKGDPLRKYVIIDMPMEDFTDTTNSGSILSIYGTAAISSAKSKFGSKSFACGGSNAGNINGGGGGNFIVLGQGSPVAPKWDFTTYDGCIELWCWLPTGFVDTMLVGQSAMSADHVWFAYVYANGKIGIGINGVNEITSPAGAFVANTWNHIAYVRRGSDTFIYLNGKCVGRDTKVVFTKTGGNGFYIGGSNFIGNAGYISNLRVTSGHYRYGGPFVTPASPFQTVLPTK